MPNYWLVKTEPSVYSYDDLVRDKRTVWDGVTNFAALKHMRAMKKGDLVYVYHSGNEKAIVGIAQIARPAYPDPQKDDDRIVVVDLVPKRRLSRPVTLGQIKAHTAFASFPLVRIPRLSVMPVEKKLWDLILKMSQGDRRTEA
jgi:predicted RNA-binding protein with PUA-like domain